MIEAYTASKYVITKHYSCGSNKDSSMRNVAFYSLIPNSTMLLNRLGLIVAG